MNLEEAREVEAGTKVMFDAEVWDFGYVGQDGHCIIYVEGERNMQDAIAVDPKLVELETVARARMARFARENPELPPGWEWHPWNGRDDVQIKWRALGPRVSRRRIEAHAKLKHEDTPAGCADAAWKIWERLSGLRREDVARIRESARPEPCSALIRHGPGHQSKTRCRLTGPHAVHEAVYGSMMQFARWRGDEASSDAFDESPELVEDEP